VTKAGGEVGRCRLTVADRLGRIQGRWARRTTSRSDRVEREDHHYRRRHAQAQMSADQNRSIARQMADEVDRFSGDSATLCSSFSQKASLAMREHVGADHALVEELLNPGGQVGNPLTGETLQSSDPLWHVPLP
jgi:hypothetical protein